MVPEKGRKTVVVWCGMVVGNYKVTCLYCKCIAVCSCFSFLLCVTNCPTLTCFQNLRCRLYRAFLAAYPLLHALWEGSVFYYHLAFMFGKSRCHSPSLYLASLMLRHLTDDEIDASQSASLPLKAALIGKRYLLVLLLFCLQCFDAAGRAAGRASSL